MPTYFLKPENSLKRAQELLSVGKESDALETLHDTIKTRRNKTWTKTYEAIMMKHLELCVELRKPYLAKDALFQYKSLTQQVSVKSLETVITHFLLLAEEKTEEAQKTSIEKVEEIDDLDQADAPENMLLSVVSGAVAQDRMDRTVLSPWLRFLWDSYRNCLELLRNNAQVETLYHKIARQTFKFCTKYQRRTEFRKLCEHLRMHLSQIQKHQYLTHGVKLTSAESLTLMQDTRLIQLDTAIQMELWQEAYRSVEDVHGMMALSKEKDRRMVKPASYVNYYDKVALVFLKAGNRLFHAAALLQKYIIFKDMKRSFSVDEAQDQATRVLLAALSIPDGAELPSDLTRHLDIEELHTANARALSNLLRLSMTPTRYGMLKEIVRLGLPEIAIAPAQQLYKLFESKSSPLRLTSEVEKQLKNIDQLDKPEYAQYIEFLRSVVATKTLKQLSHFYDTLAMDRLAKVLPFYNRIELERFLVDVSKKRLIQATIDHRENCIRFGAATANLAGSVEQEIAMDTSEQIDAGNVRDHLELLYVKMQELVDVLDGPKKRQEILKKLQYQATVYNYHKSDDYEHILARRKRIELYKEKSERVRAVRSQLELDEKTRANELKRQEEMKKLTEERNALEMKNRREEKEELVRQLNRDRLRQMKNSIIYKKMVEQYGEENLETMDPEIVVKEQIERLVVDREEKAVKLKTQEKKFDHMVRAMHLEEMKIRMETSDLWRKENEQKWEEYEEERVRNAKTERDLAVHTYARMQRLRSDAVRFLKQVEENRKSQFIEKKRLWQEKLDSEKARRLQVRHDQRKKERHERWVEENQRAEIRLKEEKEQKAREGQQKVRDEERRNRTEQKSQSRAPIAESKADADIDWRTGSRQLQPPQMQRESPRQKYVRRDDDLEERRQNIDDCRIDDSRMARERKNQSYAPRGMEVESKSDMDKNWRDGRQPQTQTQKMETQRQPYVSPGMGRDNQQRPNMVDRRMTGEQRNPYSSGRMEGESKADSDMHWRNKPQDSRWGRLGQK